MPIIATAGHVDHGKSTLVQALTGRDPDRWAEEKERGLTIDLGFAWTQIGDQSVGFVDVPGHERFIKNMLAGVGGLDVALLVVAADEGWMPQTEEHVAVLDLLDVHNAVVAITRIDLCDSDVVELAQLEVEENLAGTTLSEAALVPVSAVTGDGMEALRAALRNALDKAGKPLDIGRPRLWVDRSFVISGAGVVVTGTLVDGELGAGDAVELMPGQRPCRIRSLQSHEQDVAVAQPGSRVAANLSGLDRGDVSRGALLSRPGTSAASSRFLTTIRPVRGVDAVTDRGAYQLHAGSGAWPVKVRSVGEESLLITADDQIPLACGDRFVLRETGRRAVVGGGRVVDPRPPRASAAILSALAARLASALERPPDVLAQELLRARGVAALSDIDVDTRGGRPQHALVAGGLAMDQSRAETLLEELTETIETFQASNPLRPGIPKASLASAHDVDPSLLEALLVDQDDLIDDGATVRTAGHGAAWSNADEASWAAAEAVLRDAGLAAPRANSIGLPPELLHAALREGRLVRIAQDLVYLPESIAAMQELMSSLPNEFTVADFRDTMEISRRQAVPLLEWFDSSGVTSRRGDARTLRDPRPQ